MPTLNGISYSQLYNQQRHFHWGEYVLVPHIHEQLNQSKILSSKLGTNKIILIALSSKY